MIRSSLLMALLVVLMLSGCAYYNTFYHAKEFYEDAERKRADVPPERRPTIGLDLYEKSMKKCAKVIVEYPDSKWVDDAILLMGKCMYSKGDYLAALGKFNEVKRYYENGGNVDEAEFFRAKSLIALGRHDEAVRILDHFRSEGGEGRREEAIFLYATVEYEREHFEESAAGFARFLEVGRERDERDRALYLLGDSHRQIGNYEESYRAFQQRLDNALLSQEERLKTSLDLTEVLVEEGRFEDAYRELEEIRKDVTAREDSLKIDFRKGGGLLAEGRIDDAIALYEASLKEAPSSEVAADMAYSLGELYLEYYGQKDSAASAFRKVTSHPAKPEIKAKASRASFALNDYIKLREEYIADGADTARIQFLLAENELFQFDEVDSAYRRYNLVANQFTESEYAPKALAAKVYLLEYRGVESVEKDSVLYRLVRHYPRSSQAVEYLDRGEIRVSDDSLQVWIAEYDEIYGAPTDEAEPSGITIIGRIRVFPGEGEVEMPREFPPLFGPPGPLRLVEKIEPDHPLIPAEEESNRDVEVEVEVEVDGHGRIREAWIVQSDSPWHEGPALAAAYLCRYLHDGAEENRRASLRFRFRPD